MRFTVDQVLEWANERIDELDIVMPERSRARRYVDIRTFQYYRSQKLLDPPIEKVGTTGLYGERHALQLVAIKTMQTRWLPISEIRNELADVSDEKLRRMTRDARKGPSLKSPSQSPARCNTNRQRTWIELRVSDEVYAMVDGRVLSRATPSTLRALGEKVTAMLLDARR